MSVAENWPESGPVMSAQSVMSVTSEGEALTGTRAWLGRFIRPLHDDDLDILALWAAHTHLAADLYSTPRLLLDSPVPGSGKTTVLDHLNRLCMAPVLAGSLSSPALLARLLDAGPRTVLIDEADRNLDPKREGVSELIAVLNAGYRVGSTRPTLVPAAGGSWVARELPTFAPVAMAGNGPRLPDDTMSRTIRVLLVPDVDGVVEPSDWEDIGEDARALADRLRGWCEDVRHRLGDRPPVPPGLRGRDRERWYPLLRVAHLAGGRWPQVALDLITRDLHARELDREDAVTTYPPALRLLLDMLGVWPEGEPFVPTNRLVLRLANVHPDHWGDASDRGRPVTPQGIGRMLGRTLHVRSTRVEDSGPRGYLRADLERAARRLGLPVPVTDMTD